MYTYLDVVLNNIFFFEQKGAKWIRIQYQKMYNKYHFKLWASFTFHEYDIWRSASINVFQAHANKTVNP